MAKLVEHRIVNKRPQQASEEGKTPGKVCICNKSMKRRGRLHSVNRNNALACPTVRAARGRGKENVESRKTKVFTQECAPSFFFCFWIRWPFGERNILYSKLLDDSFLFVVIYDNEIPEKKRLSPPSQSLTLTTDDPQKRTFKTMFETTRNNDDLMEFLHKKKKQIQQTAGL